jgi:hypothetical protein
MNRKKIGLAELVWYRLFKKYIKEDWAGTGLFKKIYIKEVWAGTIPILKLTASTFKLMEKT